MNIKSYIGKNFTSLDGKTVAITGSTGGLGKEICSYLCSLGASLILVDRSRERSEAHKSELEAKYNAPVTLVTMDLQNINSVKKATEKLKTMKIDILIHNAGAYSIPRCKCQNGLDNVFVINFLSPYYITKELLPSLRERSGKVVAVGSIAHNYGKADFCDIDFSTRKKSSSVYGNAKRFLMYSLLKLFEDETNVSLSVVHPGITFTNITAHYPKLIFALIKHPMKIIFMKPKKAALCIVKGIYENTPAFSWIGPRFFNVWGLPKKSVLRTAKKEETEKIFQNAENLYSEMKDLN